MKRLTAITVLICLSLSIFVFPVQAKSIDPQSDNLIPIEEYIKIYSEKDPKLIKKVSDNEYILDKSITNIDFTRLEVSPGSQIYFLKEGNKENQLLASHECPDDYTLSANTDDVFVDGDSYTLRAWSGIGFFFGTPAAAKWCGQGANYIVDEPSDDYTNHLIVKSYCYGADLSLSYDKKLSPGFSLKSTNVIQYDREKENLQDHSAKYHNAYAVGILTSCGTSTRAGLYYNGDYDYIEHYINWYTD